ncbi:MAG: dihydropteroate synthase [Gammaproteobacteria bacterium]|nr:dihydropteroate synthase [Gammaproteobacteria bacterium]
MGVLNVTPDSFSDGGQFTSVPAALAHARQMFAEGADYIDIGGESTRPGAQPTPVQEELDRVMPVVEAIHAELPVAISVDTSKTQVMREAIAAGVSMINDVNALCAEGALSITAASRVKVCLMHKQGDSRTMQQAPHYDDVLGEIKNFLGKRVLACEQAGIAKQRLFVDPGFGFGKTLAHNLTIMHNLQLFLDLGCTLLVGVSRKSMLGMLLNKPVDQRLYGGLALAVLAVLKGASVIRTHDVAATADALKVIHAVSAQNRLLFRHG